MRRDRMSAIAGSAGAILLAGLVPKCPLCVAAALTAWGIGATAAGTVAPIVRPLLLMLAIASVRSAIADARRRRSAAPAALSGPGCCSA